MDLYERIKIIAKSKGYSINSLEKEAGFPRSYILKFKRITPSVDKMQKIADVLGVTVDYLMTGEDKQSEEPQTPDIGADLNDTVAKLSSADTLMFNGMELDEETRKLLLASVESLMANANMLAKVKAESKSKEE